MTSVCETTPNETSLNSSPPLIIQDKPPLAQDTLPVQETPEVQDKPSVETNSEDSPITTLDKIASIVETSITCDRNPTYKVKIQQMAFYWLGVYQQFQVGRHKIFTKIPVLTRNGIVKFCQSIERSSSWFINMFDLATDYSPAYSLNDAFNAAGWKPIQFWQLPIKTRVFLNRDNQVCLDNSSRVFPDDLRGVIEFINNTCLIPNHAELDVFQSMYTNMKSCVIK